MVDNKDYQEDMFNVLTKNDFYVASGFAIFFFLLMCITVRQCLSVGFGRNEIRFPIRKPSLGKIYVHLIVFCILYLLIYIFESLHKLEIIHIKRQGYFVYQSVEFISLTIINALSCYLAYLFNKAYMQSETYSKLFLLAYFINLFYSIVILTLSILLQYSQPLDITISVFYGLLTILSTLLIVERLYKHAIVPQFDQVSKFLAFTIGILGLIRAGIEPLSVLINYKIRGKHQHGDKQQLIISFIFLFFYYLFLYVLPLLSMLIMFRPKARYQDENIRIDSLLQNQ